MPVYTVVGHKIVEHELGGYIYFTIEPINPYAGLREVAYP